MWLDAVTAAAGLATAGSIVFAALQVRQTAAGIKSAERQEQAAFELRFSDRYDRCIAQIPLRVLLDQDDYDPGDEDSRRGFYDYFELCEQECYYKPRISDSTWRDWCDGINSNSGKKSFQAAWMELSSVAETQFEEFKRCFPKWCLGEQSTE